MEQQKTSQEEKSTGSITKNLDGKPTPTMLQSNIVKPPSEIAWTGNMGDNWKF
jgi:hypothetical protein